jgi:hypothetical protein
MEMDDVRRPAAADPTQLSHRPHLRSNASSRPGQRDEIDVRVNLLSSSQLGCRRMRGAGNRTAFQVPDGVGVQTTLRRRNPVSRPIRGSGLRDQGALTRSGHERQRRS